MKRTLLLASIAFTPALAFAQPAALPDRPIIVAQNDQKPDDQKPAKPKRDEKPQAQPAKPQPPAAKQAQPQMPQSPKAPAVKQAQPPEQPKPPQQKQAQPPAAQPPKQATQPQTQQPAKEAPKQVQQDRREQRKERREERRDDRQQHRDQKQDVQQQKNDQKQGVQQQKNDQKPAAPQPQNAQKPAATQPQSVQQPNATQPQSVQKQDTRQERREDRRLDALRSERKETREGDRTVIRERDRTIVKQGDRIIVRHNDETRFERAGANVREVRRNGRNERVIERPNGVRIVTVVDNNGRVVRRSRFVNGREYVLFTNQPRPGFNFVINLPPPVIHIPRNRYIVEYREAPPTLVYETLIAPPVMTLDRTFSLDEVRYNYDVRARMPRIDIDSITFDTGSWDIRPDQAAKLEPIAEAMRRAIAKNPNEVYLIEGHTDAVGTEDDNLLLSDHRAQAVAEVLTDEFQVPPENMVTQGYGEQNLKVPTQGPEERNRYVSVRRVTPLLANNQ